MTALNKQALRQTAEKAQEHGVFNMDIHSELVLNLLDELEAAEKRIAELEAHTLTVQLPADNAAESESPEDDATAWFDEGWNARGKADKEALIAVGIGLKGE
ncbi:hypothetical protein VC885_25555 [Citrobacter freundii]|uniref:hypothetical protein n=1 Tax=Citrobacter freundii TaxID=546 RepID=UPI00214D2C98|nr:hypothetical protein [Citrobacter freundii]MCR3688999.1 hypothetical protein [Citrobacter freundii]MDE8815026.1 hypothetical protein [Citrobacter freundii]MDV2277335.1 hypothetical protein [Citrobacter freundii]MEB0857527.1 hypothetical protein [Citrobacter freundii]